MDSDFIINKELFVRIKRQPYQNYYQAHPKKIGKGSTGNVYKVKAKKQPDAPWKAVKVVSKKHLKGQQYLLNQLKALKMLDHPNIIKIYEIFQDDQNIAIVQDLCTGGELFDKLCSNAKFSQGDARRVFKQVVEAIYYCHNHKIAHRDIKPQNILFLNKNSLDLKLIDFGISFNWQNSMKDELRSKCDKNFVGTAYYIAPQILSNANEYDEKCDIWSLGVLLYILLTVIPPFDGDNNQQIFAKISKYDYSFKIPQMKNVSNQAKDLIKKILVPANQRITIDQIIKHIWVTSQPSAIPLKLNLKHINNFSKYSKTKKLAASFIVSQLQPYQLDHLTKLFKQIDLNRDGEISLDEMKKALSKEGVQYAELRRLVDSIDTDHNGRINYTQFLASASGQNIFEEDSIKKAFQMLDRDGNGFVERKELIQLFTECEMKKVNGKNIDDIMQECDIDGNGVIDYEQFRACIKK